MKKTVGFVLILLFQIQANTQDAIRAVYEQLHQGDINSAYREFRALSDRDPQSLAASFGVLVALYERGLEDQTLRKEFEQRIDHLIQTASDRYEQNKRDTDALFIWNRLT